MTSKNLNWKNRKTVYKSRPFLLQPACKEALWGGQKLKEHFAKQADLDNVAESWECSTHPEGPSTVATGEQGYAADGSFAKTSRVSWDSSSQ